jgi:hypothetical protein
VALPNAQHLAKAPPNSHDKSKITPFLCQALPGEAVQLALITQNSKHVSNSWPGVLMFRNLSPFGSVTISNI